MKQKLLLIIGILISLIGYSKEIKIKAISNNGASLSFVKLSSGGICLGFTDKNGTLVFDNSLIVGKQLLLEKSTCHTKEVILEDEKDSFVFDLEFLDNSTIPEYSVTEIYSLIDQVLETSRAKSPNKQFEGMVSYLLESSQKAIPLQEDYVQMQFLVNSAKIKVLGEIKKSMKIWVKSVLKSEPLRNRFYRSLNVKSDYSCSIESSYTNAAGDRIFVIVLKKNHKNGEILNTKLVINESKKLILEFYNTSNYGTGNAISEPDYHAIYYVREGLLYPDYLSSEFIYHKNGETDTRNIKVLFNNSQ